MSEERGNGRDSMVSDSGALILVGFRKYLVFLFGRRRVSRVKRLRSASVFVFEENIGRAVVSHRIQWRLRVCLFVSLFMMFSLLLLRSGWSATLLEIEALLRSRPWCHVSTDAQGMVIGSEKVVFGGDGWVTMTMTLRKGVVEMDGFSENGERVERVRWRVEPGALSFSQNGREWSKMSLLSRRNSSGQMVIVVNGDPYAPCK
ncbi:hypothetical protein CCP2SC5_250004 [Azospirillaceae bacterium]